MGKGGGFRSRVMGLDFYHKVQFHSMFGMKCKYVWLYFFIVFVAFCLNILWNYY